MQPNKEDAVQYQQEVELGDRAAQAYELYIKDYVDAISKQLFDEFVHCSVENMGRVMEIKRLQSALKGLEISVLNDIETGKLALISLETLTK